MHTINRTTTPAESSPLEVVIQEGRDTWQGSRAELEAEGPPVPADVDWPQHRRAAISAWHCADGSYCTLTPLHGTPGHYTIMRSAASLHDRSGAIFRARADASFQAMLTALKPVKPAKRRASK